MEAAAAVQALQAAGDNADALAAAIIQADFLDAIPGEDRQKLRAARTRMRALLAKQQGAAAGGAAGSGQGAVAGSGPGAAAKSPHSKASYDSTEFDALDYQSLKWRMISKPGGTTVKPDEFYKLHGLHQQATQGDNKTERPMWADKGGLDFEGRARWDAWSAAAGLEPEEAKLRFVELYYEFSPSCLYADTRGGVTA